MKARMFAVATMLFALTALGSSFAESQVSFGIGIRVGPPPPRHDVIVAAPYPHGVWVRGHWFWNERTGRYVWTRGMWVHERPYNVWVDGSWHRGPRGWYWREGYWRHEQHERMERHEQMEHHRGHTR